MHDSTDLPVPERTGIRGDSATLFVSLELSRSTWVATSLAPGRLKDLRDEHLTYSALALAFSADC